MSMKQMLFVCFFKKCSRKSRMFKNAKGVFAPVGHLLKAKPREAMQAACPGRVHTLPLSG
jgi:hypothetical protein